MRFAPLLALSGPLLAISLLTACGGGASARLEIELAPTFDAGGASGDRQCRPDARASLPSGVDCVSVAVCRREGTGCIPVRVLRASDDHGAARTTELRFSREGADNQIQFDVDLRPGEEHELEIRAYAAGVPYARGRVEGVRAGDALVRVRLEPYGRWSCAGARADGNGPLARALHQTVALPNGDALVIGGVTGEGVSASAIDGGAVLQRKIEVYDAGEARFHEIDVTDVGGEPGFGAVFHRAYYVETTTDGRHRVRVVGGFTSPDQPGARFDALQGLTRYSSPLLPGGGAEVRDSVDLLYDPVARTIETTLVDPGVAVRRAGMNAVSEPDDEGLVVVALGLVDYAVPEVLPPAPVLSGQWYSLPERVMPGVVAQSMITPRFGHTASRLSDDTVLLWGGNVTLTTIEDIAARAGELLGEGAGAIPASVSGLPPATAFHTATRIEGGVLIAGGMAVTPFSGVAGGVSTTASAQPLTVVSLGATSTALGTPVTIDPTAWPTPILHAATELSDGSVLITGGARRSMPATGSESHLWATDSVIRVSRDAPGVYTAAPLASLIGARWGHAVTLLPGDRVLVTGGFVREAVTRPGGEVTYPLRAISSAETILLATPPEVIVGCGGEESDAGTRRDAGPDPVDAGVDASLPSDAGELDGGVIPEVDAAI